MKKINPGDQVVGLALDGETIEVHKVVKVSGDGVQVEATSGKLSRGSLRAYDENIVEQIREKERQVKALRQAIRKLYEKLVPLG